MGELCKGGLEVGGLGRLGGGGLGVEGLGVEGLGVGGLAVGGLGVVGLGVGGFRVGGLGSVRLGVGRFGGGGLREGGLGAGGLGVAPSVFSVRRAMPMPVGQAGRRRPARSSAFPRPAPGRVAAWTAAARNGQELAPLRPGPVGPAGDDFWLLRVGS